MHGRRRARGVARGQQVEQRAAEHGEDEGSLGAAGFGVAQLGRLRGGEHGKPVVDGSPGEPAHGPAGSAGERA
ncbi:hypothetical protein AB0B31_13555 [Catellatospora citrea]|uniref:hypothetical protein n=1 Tax=Catellatospora citrea TaxID=53366 RepID=UPI0033E63C5A